MTTLAQYNTQMYEVSDAEDNFQDDILDCPSNAQLSRSLEKSYFGSGLSTSIDLARANLRSTSINALDFDNNKLMVEAEEGSWVHKKKEISISDSLVSSKATVKTAVFASGLLEFGGYQSQKHASLSIFQACTVKVQEK
ncbi:uncharacterized protein F5147DRAFT_656305 [Suillus discolor]|uniref:Uncharacterized protein n=1 Tax=Suillus discolor TaxID=1912936 RepID=A0A9P7JQF2_9AGAM|nr:uncharacterized protein F5147DRAFT_656305 [Suillus discolor]KAG2097774.1 hypothetical protein F5147DRAFT_656305 [Suillus discolor]